MNGIKIIGPQTVPVATGVPKPPAPAKETETFGDYLSEAVKGIENLQKEAGEAQDKLIRGEAAELHQVMIAAEKAGISFDLLLEVRRRLLEAYQELIRMPM